MGATDAEERAQIARLYRRAGFGLGPGELDDAVDLGTDGVIDRMVDADELGVAANPDPWAGVTFHDFTIEDNRKSDRRAAKRAWTAHMATTPRPLDEWMRWFWHGHLVSSLVDVKSAAVMVAQLQMFGTLGLGDFRELLRAVTVDAAMLLYLNGAGSRAGAPNENYGRELMELFALGVGHFSEDDVKAAAAALTGWTANRDTGEVAFNPRRHDDAPRPLLGVDGVHDVDTVIDAVVSHEACPRWIARSLAEAILGADVDEELVSSLAADFRQDDLALRPLVRRILEAGVDGGFGPMILRPVPWMAAMARAAGVNPADDPELTGAEVTLALGQSPMYPPNVAGWPGDQAWLGAGVTVGRFNVAGRLAAATADGAPALVAASSGEWDELADLLGCPEGFTDSTNRALDDANRTGGRPGVGALTLAMAAPEVVQA